MPGSRHTPGSSSVFDNSGSISSFNRGLQRGGATSAGYASGASETRYILLIDEIFCWHRQGMSKDTVS